MRIAILAALASFQLGAAPVPPLDAAGISPIQDQQCPVPEEAMQGICSYVRARDSRSERQVEVAACLRPGEGQEVVQGKIQALFRDHMPRCSGFNVSRGSIFKYAVASRNYDFLYRAAHDWEADLNVTDGGEGSYGTLLDYVHYEMERNAGRSGWADLEEFRAMLVRAGARTTAQLQAGEDCRPSTRCRQ